MPHPKEGFPKLAVPFFGDPHNKDYSILGFISGLLFRETTKTMSVIVIIR